MNTYFYTTNTNGQIQYTGRVGITHPDGSGTHMKFSATTGEENGPYNHTAAEYAAMTLFNSQSDLREEVLVQMAAERAAEERADQHLQAVHDAASALTNALVRAREDNWMTTLNAIMPVYELKRTTHRLALATGRIGQAMVTK